MSALYDEILTAERHLWIDGTLRGLKLMLTPEESERRGDKVKALTAIVNSPEMLATLAEGAQNDPRVYMVTCSVNTISNDSKLARRRLGEWQTGGSYTADDMDRIRSLFVDVDGGDNVQTPLTLGGQFVAGLASEYSLPRPFTANSGRGFHARWHLDIEATRENERTVKSALDTLSKYFAATHPRANIKIDKVNGDMARPCKIYGTGKKKNGEVLPRSMMLDGGETATISLDMLRDMIEHIQSKLPAEPVRAAYATGKAYRGKMLRVESITRDDVERSLADVFGVRVTGSKDFGGGKTFYHLDRCIYADHKTPAAGFIDFGDGGFSYQCQDSECAHHNNADFLREMGLKAYAKTYDQKRKLTPEQIAERRDEQIRALAESHGLPTIETTDRQARLIVDDVLDAIRTANGKEPSPVMYIHNGKLTRLITKDDGRLCADALSEKSGAGALSRVADFYRTGKNGDVSECILPKELVNAVLTAEDLRDIPTLQGITRIPPLRRDGSIMAAAGFDAETGLFYDEVDRVPIVSNPTREDAQDAARELGAKDRDGVLADFPFADPADKVNALGLMLTAVLKDTVGLSPLAVISAPAAGTGKTLLAQMLGVLARGSESVPVSSPPSNAEEWKKQITTHLNAGNPIIIIDNVGTGQAIYNADLTSVLTTGTWNDRLFGTQTLITMHNKALWIATGNNVRLSGDMPRRVCVIRLDTKLENPLQRKFKHPDFLAWVKEQRATILGHLFTMIRAWIRDGRPQWTHGTPMPSYVRWSMDIGGILDYCGLVERIDDDTTRSLFLSNTESAVKSMTDDSRAQLAAFYAAIYEHFGGEPFTVKALRDECKRQDGAFADVMPDKLGDADQPRFDKALGILFREGRDVIAGDHRLRHTGKQDRKGGALWMIERVNTE